jgi:hypothetical protein
MIPGWYPLDTCWVSSRFNNGDIFERAMLKVVCIMFLKSLRPPMNQHPPAHLPLDPHYSSVVDETQQILLEIDLIYRSIGKKIGNYSASRWFLHR